MEFIAILCLLAVGYFVVLKAVFAKAQNPSAFQAIALVVLLVYLCVAGFLMILYYSLGNGGLLLYAVSLIFAAGFLPWYFYQCIRLRKELQAGAFVTALVYLLAVFYMTLFSRTGSGDTGLQMESFGWIRRCVELGNYDPAKHFVQNLAMFVPVGFLLFLAHQRKLGSPVLVFSFGLSISVLIETIQLLGGFGSCDVDDMISNTVGALAGVFLGKLLIYSRILPANEMDCKEADIS
jgi:hypothetical protein